MYKKGTLSVAPLSSGKTLAWMSVWGQLPSRSPHKSNLCIPPLCRYFVLWPLHSGLLSAGGVQFLVDPYGGGGLLELSEVGWEEPKTYMHAHHISWGHLEDL